MPWLFVYYTNMLLLIGAAMAALAVNLFWKRRGPEAVPLGLVMMATALWSVMYALELIGADVQTKLLFAKLKYAGIVLLPTAGLFFALAYARKRQWLRPRYLILLGVATVAPLLFILTNDAHQLFWSYETITDGGPFSALNTTAAVGFWVYAVFARLLILFAAILFIAVFIRSRGVYRKQAGLLFLCVLAPFAANAIYIIGLSPVPGLDPVPFGLVITCLLSTWAIFRLRLADIIPIAHAAIIEGMSDPVIVMDAENHIIKMNSAAQILTGKPSSEMIGQQAQRALSGASNQLDFFSREALAENKEMALGTGSAQRIYDAGLSPLINKRGIPLGKVAVLRDITERRQAEEALRASEKKYRNVFENIIDIYGEVALDGTILEISPSIEDIGGYTREEMLGKSILDFHVNPESRAEVIDELLRSRRVNEWEFLLRHKSGHVLTCSFNVELVTDEDGVPIKTVGVMRDVTERKRMEEELRKHRDELETMVADRTAELTETVDRLQQEISERKEAELQLQRRETQLNSILETSQDGIAVTSEEQRVIYGNSALASIYGYDDLSDLIGTDTTGYFAPESYPVLEWIREKLDKGEPIDEVVEFTGRRKDGSTFDAELRIAAFFEENRRLDVGAIRDVTERKRIEQQLQQSSKLAAIGELAAGVAHEINNPLATIDIQAGLMHDIMEEEGVGADNGGHEELNECLQIIGGQVSRCKLVTESLLTFAHRPSDRGEALEVNTLLRSALEFVLALTDKKPAVDLDLDERLPLFRGSSDLLQQVFINILNNALKAIDRGGQITVVSRLDENDNIQVAFRDNGPGISPAIRDHIFEPFFTTNTAGEGTGLGLSISYHIISQMKGRLDVESSPGEGATFTITLPGSAGATQDARAAC